MLAPGPERVVRIVANPNIQAGVPVIAGTRIPTRAVWCFWCAGYSIGAIKQEYPSLTTERIWAAIHFERRRRQHTRLRVRPQAGTGVRTPNAERRTPKQAQRKEGHVDTTHDDQ